MRSVNLHVGHFKTGSSSFQQSMSKVRDELLESGIYYPPGSEGNPHQHGAALRQLAKFGTRERLDATLRSFDESGADTLVMSGEAVSAASRAGIHELVDALKAAGHLRVVYSVRDWATYLPSRYAQNCRVTDGWTWWDFLDASRATFSENVDVNYALNIEAFVSSDADEVRLIHYRPESAVDDLLHAMELPDHVGSLVLAHPDEPRLNTTGHSDLIEATRLLNAVWATTRGEELNRLYVALLTGEPQPPVYRLAGAARTMLATPGVGPELVAVIDEKRETPAYLTDPERAEWLDGLTTCSQLHGLPPPPADWYTSDLPPSHRPSRATVTDLSSGLRDHLVTALRVATG
jgi:hypothetical protein